MTYVIGPHFDFRLLAGRLPHVEAVFHRLSVVRADELDARGLIRNKRSRASSNYRSGCTTVLMAQLLPLSTMTTTRRQEKASFLCFQKKLGIHSPCRCEFTRQVDCISTRHVAHKYYSQFIRNQDIDLFTHTIKVSTNKRRKR